MPILPKAICRFSAIPVKIPVFCFVFYGSRKTILKFIFPQAILLPMMSPPPEQADCRRSFTAMCLKISRIGVEFELPHGMAGSGGNWRVIPMTGWVVPDLGFLATHIWPPHPGSRPWVGRIWPYIFEGIGPFMGLPGLLGWFRENILPPLVVSNFLIFVKLIAPNLYIYIMNNVESHFIVLNYLYFLLIGIF